MQISLPDQESRQRILRKFLVYGGYELAEIRDLKILENDGGLSAYVDDALLSTDVLQQERHSDAIINPIIKSLTSMLNPKVCLPISRRASQDGQTPLQQPVHCTASITHSIACAKRAQSAAQTSQVLTT
jgi:hypothetical protein